MKNKILKFSFLFLALVAGITSCDTEPIDSGVANNNNNNNNDGQAAFSVTFSGSQYMTNTVSATIESGMLTLTAIASQGTFVLHSMGATAGTYQNSELNFAYTDNESGEIYTSINPVSGNSSSMLTISSINHQAQTISGTFQFVGYKLTEEMTIEETVFSQGVFVNVSYGDGENPDPDPEPEPSEGDYYPMAVGNTWNYDISTEEEIAEIKINTTETINGTLYYKVNELPIGVSSDIPDEEIQGLDLRAHLRKNGADYIQRFYAYIPEMMEELIPETEIEAFEVTFLKDNLEAGESWTETVDIVTHVTFFGMTQTVTANATFNSLIQEKGASLTVNGVTYTDVIKVKTTATIVSEEGTEASEATNWYAKDVGLIQSFTTDPEEGDSQMTLLDYTLN
ncbi:MAG: DUF6252 family protein [Flavobacteriaceae bacterium]